MIKPYLRKEVPASLPLHYPQFGWISATYLDGTVKKVDFTTVLTEAHLIQRIQLANAASTVALHRILISIIYPWYVLQENPNELILNNTGFDKTYVDDYFQKWENRFYLIHKDFPFLQDATLYETNTVGVFEDYKENGSDGDTETRRKTLQKSLSPISAIYPRAINLTKQDNPKSIWGLPVEDVYTTDLDISERINILITSLLDQRYTHPAVGRGARALYPEGKASDAYPAAHSFRCAVQYITEGKSLFQTLMFAVDPVEPEDLIGDIPEWECDVDPITNTLALKGYDVEYYDIVKDVNKSHRDSVNMSQLSLLFVPEYEGEQGGHVKQMRRPAFSFKHHTTPDGKKLPFPVTWNPFVAVNLEGKAYKLVTEVTESALLGTGLVAQIPFLHKTEKLRKLPQSVTVFDTNLELREEINTNELSIRVFVSSGDPSKEKNFSDFSLSIPDLRVLNKNEEDDENIRNWLRIGSELENTILYALQSFTKRDNRSLDNRANAARESFWKEYSRLFFQANKEEIKAFPEFKKEIHSIIVETFDEYAVAYQTTQPLKATQLRNMIVGSFYKKVAAEQAGNENEK